MSDFFAMNAGKKVGDLKAEAIRIDSLPMGQYSIQVASVEPFYIEKIDGYSLRWAGTIRGGDYDGQSITFGQLMNNDRSMGQVITGLVRLGLKSDEVTELVKSAGDTLPGQVVVFNKREYTSKAGRTYHDMETVELSEGDGLPF